LASRVSPISTTIAETGLLTAEEYGRIEDRGRPMVLVRERIIESSPAKPRHGCICLRIGALLLQFVDARRLGRVLSNDSEIISERGPDTVRGPHVAFFSYERLPEDADLDEYPSAPPVTLAAEETLEFPSVWPGFRATVGEFLAQYRRRQ
jgi:Uma2 family endonuclease